MKHKSTKNVNNNVIKKVCVLFFLLNFALSQEKLELKQADSLSSKEQNSETITILKGNIIFQKGDTFLSGDKAIQSNKNSQLKLYDNVKVDDKNTLSFKCHCSKGTYIRSLARDIGLFLDSGGHLISLRRIKSGNFSLEMAKSLDEWIDIIKAS